MSVSSWEWRVCGAMQHMGYCIHGAHACRYWQLTPMLLRCATVACQQRCKRTHWQDSTAVVAVQYLCATQLEPRCQVNLCCCAVHVCYGRSQSAALCCAVAALTLPSVFLMSSAVADVRDLVAVYKNPPYPIFYDVVYHSYALVPMLASNLYYSAKFSSTVLTSFITGRCNTLAQHYASMCSGGRSESRL